MDALIVLCFPNASLLIIFMLRLYGSLFYKEGGKKKKMKAKSGQKSPAVNSHSCNKEKKKIPTDTR